MKRYYYKGTILSESINVLTHKTHAFNVFNKRTIEFKTICAIFTILEKEMLYSQVYRCFIFHNAN